MFLQIAGYPLLWPNIPLCVCVRVRARARTEHLGFVLGDSMACAVVQASSG